MVSRRHFLTQALAVGAGFSGLHLLLSNRAQAAPLVGGTERFGPLVPDPAGVLDLPAGFRYQIIGRQGERMADGLRLPGRADGMATFAGPDGLTLLVRNHEVNYDAPADEGAFVDGMPLDPALLYDAGADGHPPCLGGTTTVVYDTQRQQVVRQFLSLGGTVRNCAGGPTPWGSWLTCEETVERAGGTLARDHGYIFEVPATAQPALAAPLPLRAMGRFNHEAVAVDPRSGALYLSEDRHDGLLYRFLPHTPGNLAAGGRLQALAIRDAPSLDTRNWPSETSPHPTMTPGQPLAVAWIDLDDVEAPDDDLRHRGFAAGAARFARGEGMWYGNDAVYLACTNGGPARLGQVWRYTPSPAEATAAEADTPARLTLFIEPNDTTLLNNADNLTVAPWGDLVLCEDANADSGLVGVTPTGDLYRLGRNALSNSELAGAVFSPDGSTLFVNLQHDGLTVAITGPWLG